MIRTLAIVPLVVLYSLFSVSSVVYAQTSAQANEACKTWWNNPKTQEARAKGGMVDPPKCEVKVEGCPDGTGVVAGRCQQDKCQASTACGKALEGLPEEGPADPGGGVGESGEIAPSMTDEEMETAIDKAYQDAMGKAYDPSSAQDLPSDSPFTPEEVDKIVGETQAEFSRIGEYLGSTEVLPEDVAHNSLFQKLNASWKQLTQPLDLNFAPEDFAGPGTPDWMARGSANAANEYWGSVNPNTPYYPSSGGKTTFGEARAPGGELADAEISGSLQTFFGETMPAMWETAKATAREAWSDFKKLVTPDSFDDALAEAGVDDPFGTAKTVDVQSGIISTTNNLPSGDDILNGLLVDVEPFVDSVTPEQFREGVAAYVVDRLQKGESVSTSELLALKAQVEADDDRSQWVKYFENTTGLEITDRAKALGALDRKIAAQARAEELEFLAGNAAGPNALQQPGTQIDVVVNGEVVGTIDGGKFGIQGDGKVIVDVERAGIKGVGQGDVAEQVRWTLEKEFTGEGSQGGDIRNFFKNTDPETGQTLGEAIGNSVQKAQAERSVWSDLGESWRTNGGPPEVKVSGELTNVEGNNQTFASTEFLQGYPAGTSFPSSRNQGLPGDSTGVPVGSRTGIDNMAGSPGTQTGASGPTTVNRFGGFQSARPGESLSGGPFDTALRSGSSGTQSGRSFIPSSPIEITLVDPKDLPSLPTPADIPSLPEPRNIPDVPIIGEPYKPAQPNTQPGGQTPQPRQVNEPPQTASGGSSGNNTRTTIPGNGTNPNPREKLADASKKLLRSLLDNFNPISSARANIPQQQGIPGSQLQGSVAQNPSNSPNSTQPPRSPNNPPKKEQSQPLVNPDRSINPVEFYKKALEKFANSSLNGQTPEWAKQFDIDGTPESWARFATMLCQQESGCRTAETDTDGSLKRFPSTRPTEMSFGPLQFNKGEYGLDTWEDVNNPEKVIDAFINVAKQGRVKAYFGSVQRPREITQHIAWFQNQIQPALDTFEENQTAEMPETENQAGESGDSLLQKIVNGITAIGREPNQDVSDTMRSLTGVGLADRALTAPAKEADVPPRGTQIRGAEKKVSTIVQDACSYVKGGCRYTSGFRTRAQNKAVGGAKKSRHLSGLAIDVKVPKEKGMDFAQAINTLLCQRNNCKGGFGYYGINDKGEAVFHVDTHKDHVYWGPDFSAGSLPKDEIGKIVKGRRQIDLQIGSYMIVLETGMAPQPVVQNESPVSDPSQGEDEKIDQSIPPIVGVAFGSPMDVASQADVPAPSDIFFAATIEAPFNFIDPARVSPKEISNPEIIVVKNSSTKTSSSGAKVDETGVAVEVGASKKTTASDALKNNKKTTRSIVRNSADLEKRGAASRAAFAAYEANPKITSGLKALREFSRFRRTVQRTIGSLNREIKDSGNSESEKSEARRIRDALASQMTELQKAVDDRNSGAGKAVAKRIDQTVKQTKDFAGRISEKHSNAVVVEVQVPPLPQVAITLTTETPKTDRPLNQENPDVRTYIVNQDANPTRTIVAESSDSAGVTNLSEENFIDATQNKYESEGDENAPQGMPDGDSFGIVQVDVVVDPKPLREAFSDWRDAFSAWWRSEDASGVVGGVGEGAAQGTGSGMGVGNNIGPGVNQTQSGGGMGVSPTAPQGGGIAANTGRSNEPRSSTAQNSGSGGVSPTAPTGGGIPADAGRTPPSTWASIKSAVTTRGASLWNSAKNSWSTVVSGLSQSQGEIVRGGDGRDSASPFNNVAQNTEGVISSSAPPDQVPGAQVSSSGKDTRVAQSPDSQTNPPPSINKNNQTPSNPNKTEQTPPAPTSEKKSPADTPSAPPDSPPPPPQTTPPTRPPVTQSFSRGGMSLLQGLLQGLFAFFNFGGGEEEEKPQVQPQPQPTPQPEVIVGAIVANPSLINSGATTTLSWSSVGTDMGSSTCAVISADFAVIHRGAQNGSISSPSLTESTRFGLVCNTKNATDKLLHETLVRVRGDESDPERIFTPEEIARSQSTPASTGGSGASGGSGGGSGGSGGQSGNPAPQDVRTCDPEQPINSFIRCLCEAEPNPAGCAIPPGGLR